MTDDRQILPAVGIIGAFAQEKKEKKNAGIQKEIDKLNDLAFVDNRALFVCCSVFPFDLFPDIITVDRNKITISKKYFFFTRSIQSIMIKDLLTIVVRESVLFATLEIVDKLFPQETIHVQYLQKRDTQRLRWLVEGLIVGEKEKIDFTKISNEELVPKLEEIGKTKAR